MKLSEYGITESPMDIRWRFLISCLKCEYDNYQYVYLEQATTYYLDTDAGRKAFSLDDGQIRTEDLTKVNYSFAHTNNFEIKYNNLLDFQQNLEELFPLLKGDAGRSISDAEELEDGEHYIDIAPSYFDISEVFEITTQNASSLLGLLDALDLNTGFWVAAGEAMRDTLTRHTCEHEWSDDECQKCGVFSYLDE